MDHTLHAHSLALDTRKARRDAPPSPGPALHLADEDALCVRLHAGTVISVTAGRLWLTQPGDFNDYFVEAGELHVVTRGGLVVMQADAAGTTVARLGPATVPPAIVPGRPGFA